MTNPTFVLIMAYFLTIINFSGCKTIQQSEGLVVGKHYKKTQVLTSITDFEDKIWFKDSCVIFERNGFFKRDVQVTRDSFTVTDDLYRTYKYSFLDLKTLMCQDYYNFSDTARPVCSYKLKSDESIGWQFYYSKKPTDLTKTTTNLPDTVIKNINYKRIKTVGSYDDGIESIFYLNCKQVPNIFHINRTMDESYPNCQVKRYDNVDGYGQRLASFEFEITKNKLDVSEVKVFRAWTENALTNHLPIITLGEVDKLYPPILPW